ncbi:DUF998 domain-containing protein [Pseudactinotalea suaedae]|uniref:DUF998 domain-containing protein n=1 Tax=Pseudactinotalea suaedae TaxID=1524924 RepID=UPI0012E0FBCF|nr:DUF998 domain-containing protein [Pseudactinotalea suaedae]
MSTTVSTRVQAGSATTKRLLVLGATTGPLFVIAVVVQAATRPGFDPRTHALSMLSLGHGGWVQTLTFVLCGALAVCGAVGLRAALTAGPGRRWGPLLIAIFGFGLIWGGVFPTDPALGFPADAPALAAPSWHGILHNLSPTLTGLALIAACVVFARRYAEQRAFGRMTLALVMPVVYLVVGFAAFPLGDLRWLLAGGAVLWIWPSVVLMSEYRRITQAPE